MRLHVWASHSPGSSADGDLNTYTGFRRLRDDETVEVVDDRADGGVGGCEDDAESSVQAGTKMGRREPTMGVMLSKGSMAVYSNTSGNGQERIERMCWYRIEATRNIT